MARLTVTLLTAGFATAGLAMIAAGTPVSADAGSRERLSTLTLSQTTITAAEMVATIAHGELVEP